MPLLVFYIKKRRYIQKARLSGREFSHPLVAWFRVIRRQCSSSYQMWTVQGKCASALMTCAWRTLNLWVGGFQLFVKCTEPRHVNCNIKEDSTKDLFIPLLSMLALVLMLLLRLAAAKLELFKHVVVISKIYPFILAIYLFIALSQLSQIRHHLKTVSTVSIIITITIIITVIIIILNFYS